MDFSSAWEQRRLWWNSSRFGHAAHFLGHIRSQRSRYICSRRLQFLHHTAPGQVWAMSKALRIPSQLSHSWILQRIYLSAMIISLEQSQDNFCSWDPLGSRYLFEFVPLHSCIVMNISIESSKSRRLLFLWILRHYLRDTWSRPGYILLMNFESFPEFPSPFVRSFPASSGFCRQDDELPKKIWHLHTQLEF